MKSIFEYITDNSKYINKNECNNYEPPFLTYIPTGILNVDVDSELNGRNRKYCRCVECKYKQTKSNTNIYPNNKKECKN